MDPSSPSDCYAHGCYRTHSSKDQIVFLLCLSVDFRAPRKLVWKEDIVTTFTFSVYPHSEGLFLGGLRQEATPFFLNALAETLPTNTRAHTVNGLK